MTLADAIHSQAEKLPPEKQIEVLDFILFLQNHLKNTCPELDLEEKRQHLIRAFHQLRSSKAFDKSKILSNGNANYAKIDLYQVVRNKK